MSEALSLPDKNTPKTINTISYNNTPLGTLEKPLPLRTYVPDPGLLYTVNSIPKP